MGEPQQFPGWVTEEQAKAMADEARQSASGEGMNAAQVQALIDEALARQAEAHNTAIQALGASLRGSVATFVPEHSGGPGTEIAETWSYAEQQRAKAAAEAA